MSKKIKVGVVFGGKSGEHEVSIVSAKSVMEHLDKSKYEVVPIGIAKTGEWIAGSKAVEFLQQGLKQLPFKSIFISDPTSKGLIKVEKDEVSINPQNLDAVDIIFPLVHGTFGEDGKLQGLLEMADLPYVGPEVAGSAVAMDKIIQKQLFESFDLPQVDFVWFKSTDYQKDPHAIEQLILKKLNFPLYVKPANLGSSVGISKAHNQSELKESIELAAEFDRKVLVEQGIENVMEVEVGVLGNDEPKASVPGQVKPSNEFYDYDAKYVDDASEVIIPAPLPLKVTEKIQMLAEQAFIALDLCGMARVDFLVDEKNDKIYINEVNTLPGFTSISMYPKLWQASGVSYEELLDRLVQLGLDRYEQKKKLKYSYQPKKDWHK